jgi:hypothetical protein
LQQESGIHGGELLRQFLCICFALHALFLAGAGRQSGTSSCSTLRMAAKRQEDIRSGAGNNNSIGTVSKSTCSTPRIAAKRPEDLRSEAGNNKSIEITRVDLTYEDNPAETLVMEKLKAAKAPIGVLHTGCSRTTNAPNALQYEDLQTSEKTKKEELGKRKVDGMSSNEVLLRGHRFFICPFGGMRVSVLTSHIHKNGGLVVKAPEDGVDFFLCEKKELEKPAQADKARELWEKCGGMKELKSLDWISDILAKGRWLDADKELEKHNLSLEFEYPAMANLILTNAFNVFHKKGTFVR